MVTFVKHDDKRHGILCKQDVFHCYDEQVHCKDGYACVVRPHNVQVMAIWGYPLIVKEKDLPKHVRDHFIAKKVIPNTEIKMEIDIPAPTNDLAKNVGAVEIPQKKKEFPKTIKPKLCECGCGEYLPVPRSGNMRCIKGHKLQ